MMPVENALDLSSWKKKFVSKSFRYSPRITETCRTSNDGKCAIRREKILKAINNVREMLQG